MHACGGIGAGIDIGSGNGGVEVQPAISRPAAIGAISLKRIELAFQSGFTRCSRGARIL